MMTYPRGLLRGNGRLHSLVDAEKQEKRATRHSASPTTLGTRDTQLHTLDGPPIFTTD